MCGWVYGVGNSRGGTEKRTFPDKVVSHCLQRLQAEMPFGDMRQTRETRANQRSTGFVSNVSNVSKKKRHKENQVSQDCQQITLGGVGRVNPWGFRTETVSVQQILCAGVRHGGVFDSPLRWFNSL